MSDQQTEITEADVKAAASAAAKEASDNLMAKVQSFNQAGVSFVQGPGVLLFQSIGDRPTVEDVRAKAVEYGIVAATEDRSPTAIPTVADVLAGGTTTPPPPPPEETPDPYKVALSRWKEAADNDMTPQQARRLSLDTVLQAAINGDERVIWTPAKHREAHDEYFGIQR